MENAGLVRGRQRVRHTDQQLDALAPAVSGVPHPVAERTAINQLGDQILAAVELAGIMHRDDVGMVE